MYESVTENMVTEDAQTKNGEIKWNTMELFLTGEQILRLGTCMFVELVTSQEESGTIKERLSDVVLNNQQLAL